MHTQQHTPVILVILAFLVMTVFGFMENLKGVLIPPIRDQFSVAYGDIGFMLFVSTLGYLCAVFVGGAAGDRFGQKTVLAAGFALIIFGVTGMLFGQTFVSVMLMMFLMNAGFGCFEIGANSLGARIFVKNTAVMMNLMHLFYGVGSSISPRLAGILLVNQVSWNYVYFYALSLVVVAFLILLCSPFPQQQAESDETKLSLNHILSDRRVWGFVAVLGLCIVAEIGTANWLVTFLQAVRGLDEASSSFYLSLYFVTFTIGRLVGGYIAERLGYIRTLLGFALLAMLFFGGGLTLGVSIFFSFVGFSVSIMFPTVMAIIMKEFRQGTSSVMGFVITAAGAVNMVVNWLIGKSSDIFGVYIGFGSILLYMALIIVSLLVLARMLNYQKNPAQAAESL